MNYKSDGVSTIVVNIPFSSKPAKVQCSLYGTHVCPYPETCSGYEDRQCNKWQEHSGK